MKQTSNYLNHDDIRNLGSQIQLILKLELDHPYVDGTYLLRSVDDNLATFEQVIINDDDLEPCSEFIFIDKEALSAKIDKILEV